MTNRLATAICVSARSVHVGRPPADVRKQEPGILGRNGSKGRKIRYPITATSRRMREGVHRIQLSLQEEMHFRRNPNTACEDVLG